MRRSIYIAGNKKTSEKNNIPITRKESPASVYAAKKVSVQTPLTYDENSYEYASGEKTPQTGDSEATEKAMKYPESNDGNSKPDEDKRYFPEMQSDLPTTSLQTESSRKNDTTDTDIENNVNQANEIKETAQKSAVPQQTALTEDNYGIVIVVARTASGAIPISNALVTISSVIGDTVTVVASTETGVDGRTLPIPLPSQPPSNSNSPGNDVPYSLYNIDTDANGFYGVRNIDVPVYPGITSIQQVELIPFIEGTIRRNGTELKYKESSPPTL